MLQNKGFNESYNGSARVQNLCTFPSQRTQNKQVHTKGHYFYKTNLAAASIYRHKSGFLSNSILKYFHSKVLPFSDTRLRHPCARCPTRCDRGQNN